MIPALELTQQLLNAEVTSKHIQYRQVAKAEKRRMEKARQKR